MKEVAEQLDTLDVVEEEDNPNFDLELTVQGIKKNIFYKKNPVFAIQHALSEDQKIALIERVQEYLDSINSGKLLELRFPNSPSAVLSNSIYLQEQATHSDVMETVGGLDELVEALNDGRMTITDKKISKKNRKVVAEDRNDESVESKKPKKNVKGKGFIGRLFSRSEKKGSTNKKK